MSRGTALIIPAVPPVRGAQQRHSIVDLSASIESKSDDLVQSASSTQKQQIRKTVASKRRPSASLRHFRTSSSLGAGSAEEGKECLGGGPENTSKECNGNNYNETSSSLPGYQVVLKEFLKPGCAVYEPIVTYRALIGIGPLFYRCITYLEDYYKDQNHSFDIIVAASDTNVLNLHEDSEGDISMLPNSSHNVSSSSSLPIDEDVKDLESHTMSKSLNSKRMAVSNVLPNIRKAGSEFYFKLKLLEENDYALMRLIRETEREHTVLYDFQLRWCSRYSVSSCCKEEDEFKQMFRMQPWETAMLKRLENLEAARIQIEELGRRGSDIIRSIDKIMRSALNLVIQIMEHLSNGNELFIVPTSSLVSIITPSPLEHQIPTEVHPLSSPISKNFMKSHETSAVADTSSVCCEDMSRHDKTDTQQNAKLSTIDSLDIASHTLPNCIPSSSDHMLLSAPTTFLSETEPIHEVKRIGIHDSSFKDNFNDLNQVIIGNSKNNLPTSTVSSELVNSPPHHFPSEPNDLSLT